MWRRSRLQLKICPHDLVRPPLIKKHLEQQGDRPIPPVRPSSDDALLTQPNRFSMIYLNVIIPKTNVSLSEQNAFHQHLEESCWPHLHTSQSARVKTRSSKVINRSTRHSQTASNNCDSVLRHQVGWRVSQRLNPLDHRRDSHSEPDSRAWLHRRWHSRTAASTNDCQPGSLS